MAKLNQVFVDQDDRVLAVHDQDQAVPADAYDAPGRTVRVVYLDPEIAPSPTETMRNDLGQVVTVRQCILPPGWEQSYKPPVPDVVTSTQGKLALLAANKLDAVEAAINAISDPMAKRAAQIQYDAANWHRSNKLFTDLADVVGGPAQVDALFRAAVAP